MKYLFILYFLLIPVIAEAQATNREILGGQSQCDAYSHPGRTMTNIEWLTSGGEATKASMLPVGGWGGRQVPVAPGGGQLAMKQESLQDKIDRLEEKIDEQNEQIEEQNLKLKKQGEMLDSLHRKLGEQSAKLDEQDRKLKEQSEER